MRLHEIIPAYTTGTFLVYEDDAELSQNEDDSTRYLPHNLKFTPPKHSGGMRPVWINIAKFDPYFERDVGFYIGPGGTGNRIGNRYQRFQQWLRQGDPIEMPEVALNDINGRLRIAFGNGRHRYSVIRDMGIARMPVMVPIEQVEDFKRLFS